MVNIQDVTTNVKYTTYGINCLGLIGSAISIVIFSRKKFAKKSIGVYCKCLALFDIFVVFNLVVKITEIIIKQPIFNRYEVVCKLITFISSGISPIPGWILAAFSLDQLICVSNESIKQRFSFTKNKWFQYFLIIGIFIVHLGIYSPVFVLVSIQDIIPDQNRSIFVCKADSDVLPIMFLIESSSLPFLIIIVSTTQIVKRLVKVKRTISVRSMNSDRSALKSRHVKYAFNSVILNVMFVVLTTPLLVYYLLPPFYYTTSSLINSICFLFFNLNFSLHFFVYLCVNSVFRHELIIFIRSKCRIF